MDWLKRQDWPQIVVVGLVQAVIGVFLVAAINALVKDDLVRDIGIVVTCVAVAVGGAWAIVKVIRTGEAHRPPNLQEMMVQVREQAEEVESTAPKGGLVGSGKLEADLAEQRRLLREHYTELEGILGPRPADGGAFGPANIDAEAQAVLAVYERQRSRPLYESIKLELRNVDCSHVNDASPSVMLRFDLRNYLPVPVELVRVVSGAGTVGAHVLPDLPPAFSAPAHPCSGTIFQLKLPLHGQVPEHLKSEAYAECPQPLRWEFRGQWFARVNGEEKLIWDTGFPLDWTGIANVPRA